MKIEIREYAGLSEMAAPEGYYLTQANDDPNLARICCTRRILLPGEQVARWRLATAEEKDRYTPASEPLPAYEQQVEALIRQQYSVSDELAILRQRDTKPKEFKAYFEYCEQCKAEAKRETVQ